MENYEINILKRNGDWKKLNPNDLLLETAKKETKKNINNDKSLIFYINQFNSIINKLEDLENEKYNLKSQLKNFEEEFQNKKKKTETIINKMNQEVEMLNKAIGIIKNLKNF
tara:strand:- start:56 stop:391 length:336 start_codon:yes stop_codon:yes gene_type:complete